MNFNEEGENWFNKKPTQKEEKHIMNKEEILEELSKFNSKDIREMVAENLGITVEEVSNKWDNLLKEEDNFPAKDVLSLIKTIPDFNGNGVAGEDTDKMVLDTSPKDGKLHFWTMDLASLEKLDYRTSSNLTGNNVGLYKKYEVPIGTQLKDVFNFTDTGDGIDKSVLFGDYGKILNMPERENIVHNNVGFSGNAKYETAKSLLSEVLFGSGTKWQGEPITYKTIDEAKEYYLKDESFIFINCPDAEGNKYTTTLKIS